VLAVMTMLFGGWRRPNSKKCESYIATPRKDT
jgi:hypothetical protein